MGKGEEEDEKKGSLYPSPMERLRKLQEGLWCQ
jgi:hypothetical protein